MMMKSLNWQWNDTKNFNRWLSVANCFVFLITRRGGNTSEVVMCGGHVMYRCTGGG